MGTCASLVSTEQPVATPTTADHQQHRSWSSRPTTFPSHEEESASEPSFHNPADPLDTSHGLDISAPELLATRTPVRGGVEGCTSTAHPHR